MATAPGHFVDGGTLASPDDFFHPQIVSIRYGGSEHSCTGALIASDTVLTAAHCTNANAGNPSQPYQFDSDPSNYQIVFLNFDAEAPPTATSVYELRRVFSALNPDGPAGGTVFTASEVLKYPSYAGLDDVQNDFALLRLPISIPRGFIRPLGVAPALTQAQLAGYRAELISAGPGPSSCDDPGGAFVQRLRATASEGETVDELLWSGYHLAPSETSRLCAGDSGAPVLSNTTFSNSIGLLDNVVVSVASVINAGAGSGTVFYGPRIRTNPRNWLRQNALDRDGDGVEASLDNCDLEPTTQTDSDNDGSGDACDPCPHDAMPPSTNPLENAAFANVDNDWLLDCKDPCRELNDEFLPTAGSFNTLDLAAEDLDGDGLRDCADPCVGTGGSDGDLDDDGVCDAVDQCPSAFDPVDRNSNFLAEYAATNFGGFPNKKGDACEPVPVPDFSVVEDVASTHGTLIDCPILATTEEDCLALDAADAGCCNLDPEGPTPKLLCNRAERTTLEIWPTRSNHPTQSNLSRTVNNLEVLPTFCIRSNQLGRTCTSLINGDLKEPAVRGAPCFEGCANPETAFTAYKRVTFQPPGPTNPDGVTTAAYNKHLRNGAPIEWIWNAEADLNRFAFAGLLPADVSSVDEFIGNLALWNDSLLGGALDPDGSAWVHQSDIAIRFHAANYMPVSDFDVEAKFPDAGNQEGVLGPATYQPIDRDVCTACVWLPVIITAGNLQAPQGDAGGLGAAELVGVGPGGGHGNEPLKKGDVDPTIFEDGPAPTEEQMAAAAGAFALSVTPTSASNAHLLWRVGERRVTGGYEAPGQGAHEAAIIFDGQGVPSVLRPGREDCNADQLIGLFDPDFLDLFGAGHRWVNASEPSSELGAGAIAVGVDERGRATELAGAIDTDYATLFSDPSVRPSAGAAPPTLAAGLVYSRLRGTLFVLGGNDPLSGRPRGRVWQRGLADASWQSVQTSYRPVKVLAATYNFRDDRLYFLDEREIVTSNGARQLQVHLIRLAWRTGGATTLHRWVRSTAWDQQHLSIDLNGKLVLASGASRSGQHAVARLAVTGTLASEGRFSGTNSVLTPVVVDPSGFTVVLHDAATDLVQGVRYRELPLSAATLNDLDAQL